MCTRKSLSLKGELNIQDKWLKITFNTVTHIHEADYSDLLKMTVLR